MSNIIVSPAKVLNLLRHVGVNVRKNDPNLLSSEQAEKIAKRILSRKSLEFDRIDFNHLRNALGIEDVAKGELNPNSDIEVEYEQFENEKCHVNLRKEDDPKNVKLHVFTRAFTNQERRSRVGLSNILLASGWKKEGDCDLSLRELFFALGIPIENDCSNEKIIKELTFNHERLSVPLMINAREVFELIGVI